MKWAIRIWVGAAVLLPALIGLGLLFAPMAMTPADSPIATPAALAGTAGTRDIVYSGVIVAAIFMLGWKAVGVLMVGRGVIDLVDGIRGMLLGAPFAGAIMPIIFALFSFAVAFVLLRQAEAEQVPVAAAGRKGF